MWIFIPGLYHEGVENVQIYVFAICLIHPWC
jgi:hypothetical protein